MPDTASPDAAKEDQELARFLQDWTVLWREEMRAQAADPGGMPPVSLLAGMANGALPAAMTAAMEPWRAALLAWTGKAPSGDPPAAPGTQATPAAFDPRDAEIERLARRVDELEARLARLESPRRKGASRRRG